MEGLFTGGRSHNNQSRNPSHNKTNVSPIFAPHGKIYFAPFSARRVLSIDPQAQTTEMVGPELDGENKFSPGGLLAPNGMIYFAPFSAHRVLSIVP